MKRSFFANPFTFFNQTHKHAKTMELFTLKNDELCACNIEGKPQAFFVLSTITKEDIATTLPTNPLVLGSQRDEEFLIKHKPVLMLEHKLV